MNLSLLLRDVILIAVGINISLLAFSYMLGNKSLLATSAISLASLLVALAIKAYDILD